MQLTISGGLQVITESTLGAGEEQNVELYLSGEYALWRFTTPELSIDMGLNLYPNLKDTGRIRSDIDLRIRWEIGDDLFFDIAAYGSSDNRADGGSEFDYGVTTGIGWEY